MARSLALALGSGGARGLAYIGVLDVLEREGVPVDLVVGTSIGALIGGAWALGVSTHDLEAMALTTRVRRIVSLGDLLLPGQALVGGRALERIVRSLAGGMVFTDTEVPFACVAADIVSGREVVLRDGSLTSALRASMSVPGVFPPVERDGQLLVDGVVRNAVPVNVARDLGGDIVVAVTTYGSAIAGGTGDAPTGQIQGGAHARSAGNTGLLERVTARTSALVRQKVRLPDAYRHATRSLDLMVQGVAEPNLRSADLVIAPQVADVARYGFRDAEHIIAAGRRAAERQLEEMRCLLG